MKARTHQSERSVAFTISNSSIDLILRNRSLDHFSEPDDRKTTERALAVLASDKHDWVVV